MSTKAKLIEQILSTSTQYKKTNLSKLTKDALQLLLPQSQQKVELEIPSTKKISKIERHFLDFSDDENDEELHFNEPVFQDKPPPLDVSHSDGNKKEVFDRPKEVNKVIDILPVEIINEVKQTAREVLKGKKNRPKIIKYTATIIKSEINYMIKQFNSEISKDIKLFKKGIITEEELINNHNNIRDDIDSEVDLLFLNFKPTPKLLDWYNESLSIILTRVDQSLPEDN